MKKNYDTKYIFMLSIPIFVELFLQMLVGNVDQIMLSAFSQSAVASIGNGNQIMNLFILVLNMMASAITILISQYLGANKKEKVNETINVSLLVMSVASIAITLLFLFIDQFFKFCLCRMSCFTILVSIFWWLLAFCWFKACLWLSLQS